MSTSKTLRCLLAVTVWSFRWIYLPAVFSFSRSPTPRIICVGMECRHNYVNFDQTHTTNIFLRYLCFLFSSLTSHCFVARHPSLFPWQKKIKYNIHSKGPFSQNLISVIHWGYSCTLRLLLTLKETVILGCEGVSLGNRAPEASSILQLYSWGCLPRLATKSPSRTIARCVSADGNIFMLHAWSCSTTFSYFS
jgi:hypothetical protein